MSDSASRDHPAVLLPPPLVFLLALIAGWLLQRYVLALPLELSRTARIALAAPLLLAAGVLTIGAMRLFRRTDQDPTPWTPTPEILATGVYRRTRNPMYLGLALLQAGIGFGMANAWVVALVPVSLVAVYLTAVRHEEAYLEREFGDAYLSYKASVRRWL